MSAELLRKAATILRERAEAATVAPWEAFADGLVWADRLGDPVSGSTLTEDSDYIATMHPGVGLALADWLDVEAYHIESHDCAARCEPDGCERGEKAHTLARLIVGEQP